MKLSAAAGSAAVRDDAVSLANIIHIVNCLAKTIVENEVRFCELDSVAGDGDFGMSLAKGFRQLQREWNGIIGKNAADIGSFLHACSLVIMEYCGGASGPIWGSAFWAAAKSAGGNKELTVAQFAAMMQAMVKGIQATGERSFGRGAEVGDKTLIDALVPAADSWSESARNGVDCKQAFAKAAEAAVAGAKNTETIVARMGRAGTVGERSLGHPDAGAYAVGPTARWKGFTIDLDWRTSQARAGGGYSGSQVLPIACYTVAEARREGITLPMYGGGGVFSWEAAAKLIMAGSQIAQLGSLACCAGPRAVKQAIEGLGKWMDEAGYTDMPSLCGAALKLFDPAVAQARNDVMGDAYKAASVDAGKCIGCGRCVDACWYEGIEMDGNKAHKTDACIGCGYCFQTCPAGALEVDADTLLKSVTK